MSPSKSFVGDVLLALVIAIVSYEPLALYESSIALSRFQGPDSFTLTSESAYNHVTHQKSQPPLPPLPSALLDSSNKSGHISKLEAHEFATSSLLFDGEWLVRDFEQDVEADINSSRNSNERLRMASDLAGSGAQEDSHGTTPLRRMHSRLTKWLGIVSQSMKLVTGQSSGDGAAGWNLEVSNSDFDEYGPGDADDDIDKIWPLPTGEYVEDTSDLFSSWI